MRGALPRGRSGRSSHDGWNVCSSAVPAVAGVVIELCLVCVDVPPACSCETGITGRMFVERLEWWAKRRVTSFSKSSRGYMDMNGRVHWS